MAWTAPTRNFDKIQFAVLRTVIDSKLNTVHDELSDCFYNRKPFRTFGILTKERFDKLHGLIFKIYDVIFHTENLKQRPTKNIIPEDQYNNIYDDVGTLIGKKSDIAQVVIDQLKTEGIELVIT